MLRTLRSCIIGLFLGIVFLNPLIPANAQNKSTVNLKAYLNTLEEKYAVKFSFIDEAVGGITIEEPNSNTLNAILQAIALQTQLEIKKLDNRYYALSKSAFVSLCGKVLDNFAENTVSGATVELINLNRAIITDLDGSFRLEKVPRDASLKIRYLGYITKYISVNELAANSDCTTILLAQNYERLEEVVVYEFLTSGIIKQEDASITLNTAELGVLPGLIEPDILQSVQALPGIKSIDETVSDINVRGGTNDQNLTLWNGIKMYQSGHFFGLISAFNPYLTDKVTVYKNGTPTQYGDGVSSVISMETKNDIGGEFFGGAGFNFISGDIYGQIPVKDNLAFQFSARRSTTDFLNTPAYDSFTDRAFQDTEVKNQQNQEIDEGLSRDEKFFFYDFTGKLLYDINEDHKLRLSFIAIDNDLDFSETDIITNETSRSFLDQTNISTGLQLQSQWRSNFSSNLNVYFSKYNLDAQSFFPNQVQRLNQKNIVEERALKLDTNFKISETASWHNGYQYIETGITNKVFNTQPPFDIEEKGVIRIHAPYTQFSYKSFEDNFIASGGFRMNYMENLGTFSKILIEPRINLNLRIAKNLRAQLLGEFKSQSTNQVIDLEQNFLGIEKRRWTLSDDNELPITKSKQGSIGLNHAKNSLYIGLEGFYKQVDGISTRTQGFQNENQFNGEIGSYEIKGFEFLINKKGNNYSTWLSYTFNKNDYTYDSIVPMTFPNNLDVRHTMTFASTYTIKRLKMSFGINYRTGKPFTEPQATNAIDNSFFPARITYQEPNSNRLPDYFRADASAVYQWEINRRTKAKIGVSLLNITNKKNILNRYYRISEDNSAIEKVENNSLGITPNISFRVSF
ncbi:TonB-dependent receptor [Croceitalea rosinachiae]|uniref:Carboxypeptidase-like regulatory domain-containing protein n=1 Tax=Croceitalea rosinachiae TaxID=3075596 RepID=A0ABU3ACR1_9FLAO|nr:carboxypeptidase-like regulatory domain-containing protein [Croceitalea sp. F388]MDT0607975.1 carboxypeptidase-like regulatory domain-containing protein [Croceitalea sp. F388]